MHASRRFQNESFIGLRTEAHLFTDRFRECLDQTCVKLQYLFDTLHALLKAMKPLVTTQEPFVVAQNLCVKLPLRFPAILFNFPHLTLKGRLIRR